MNRTESSGRTALGRHRLLGLIGGLSVIILLVVVATLLLRQAAQDTADIVGWAPAASGRAVQIQPAAAIVSLQQASGGPLSGVYEGTVNLTGAYSGVYSDTTATPVAMDDLGYIDLSLQLAQVQDLVSGYVSLDTTLVFSQVHTIQITTTTGTSELVETGPLVQGSYDGQQLHLVSELFSQAVAGQTVAVRRQFNLSTSEIQNDGETLLGDYRETVWNGDQNPATVVGIFQLQRPVPHQVTLPQATSTTAPTATPETTPTSEPEGHDLYLPSVQQSNQP